MPLVDVFWVMLLFFLFVAWIWILVSVIADLFMSRDLSGWSKALWVGFMILIPWLGVIAYLIARGNTMAERHVQALVRANETRAYIESNAGVDSAVDELQKLVHLQESGAITAEEFQVQKAKLLNGGGGGSGHGGW